MRGFFMGKISYTKNMSFETFLILSFWLIVSIPYTGFILRPFQLTKKYLISVFISTSLFICILFPLSYASKDSSYTSGIVSAAFWVIFIFAPILIPLLIPILLLPIIVWNSAYTSRKSDKSKSRNKLIFRLFIISVVILPIVIYKIFNS